MLSQAKNNPMDPYTPFPSVASLAGECGVKWHGFEMAAEGTKAAEEKLCTALQACIAEGRILGPDCCLVLCGSFARFEMTDASDYDWTLLVDGVVDNVHAAVGSQIVRALQAAKLEEPGSSGTFGNLVFSHELVHRIGGRADSNANLTRRMLMLLESRPFGVGSLESSNGVWNNVLKNLLERYFEQDVHFSPVGTRRVPRFLLNDLTRYWRTICVDYAAKHREQDGRKWAIRNAKLRLSRKLIYASGLAFCLSCELAPPAVQLDLFREGSGDPQPFIQRAFRFARTPSLEYLAAFVQAFVGDPAKRRRVAELIFGSYNEWLLLISDKVKRDRLTLLTHDEAQKGDEVFEKVRQIGTDFASGLKLLFFNRETDADPIANLSLEYVGF